MVAITDTLCAHLMPKADSRLNGVMPRLCVWRALRHCAYLPEQKLLPCAQSRTTRTESTSSNAQMACDCYRGGGIRTTLAAHFSLESRPGNKQVVWMRVCGVFAFGAKVTASALRTQECGAPPGARARTSVTSLAPAGSGSHDHGRPGTARAGTRHSQSVSTPQPTSVQEMAP